MQAYETAIHPELAAIVNLAPVLVKLINSEVTLIITDTEKVICQVVDSPLNFGDITNKPLEEKDPLRQVLASRKLQIMEVPKEIYGVPFRGANAPIYSKDGELLGALSINTTLSNQKNLIEVAEQLTMSSEEMSASTLELSNIANELKNHMDHLSHAQLEMYKQVDQSSKMLEVINGIAKNTRILGFNAGIEAARSGEYGRGFSVVAKEITKLADSSAKSVDDINQLMKLLKEQVNEVKEVVNLTATFSKQQFDSIHEISTAMNNLTEVAETIEELAKKI